MNEDTVSTKQLLVAKYTTAALLLVCSIFFCFLPHILKRRSSRADMYLQLGQCLAAGVFLSAGLMHLLPEAVELVPVQDGEYPFVYLAALLGFVAIFILDLGLEQASTASHDNRRVPPPCNGSVIEVGCARDGVITYANDSLSVSTNGSNFDRNEISPSKLGHKKLVSIASMDVDTFSKADNAQEPLLRHTRDNSDEGNNRLSSSSSSTSSSIASLQGSKAPTYGTVDAAESEHQPHLLLSAWASGRFLVLLALFLALSVHSVIAGLALGSTSSNKVHSLAVLIIAIAFHKMLAAYGLGHAALVSNTPIKRQGFLFIAFSFSTPIGIIIGAALDIKNPSTLGYIKAVAAGMFLFIGSTHMIDEVKQNFRHAPPLWQLTIYLLGIACMCALVLWT